MKWDDDGTERFLGVRLGLRAGDEEVPEAERNKRFSIRQLQRLGLKVRKGLLQVRQQFVELFRTSACNGGVPVGTDGIAMGVLGQEAQQDTMGGDHCFGRVSRIVG